MNCPQPQICRVEEASQALHARIEAARGAALRPPPKRTLSEWADAERRLSRESSPEPGRFNTDRIGYLRGIQDAISDPHVQAVVVMKPAQAAWTTAIENAIGYHIDLDPCPILMVEPRDRDCEKFSKKRLDPMLRDSPTLADKVSPLKSRNPGNTILEKIFPGGSLTLVGANSPAGLSGDSVRLAIFDEVDRYPPSAGDEGDPIDLGKQRTEAFWNRKWLMGSTPRNKDTSRIEPAYLESDQRRYYVPCPDCGHKQVLRWDQVRWKKELQNGDRVWEVPANYIGTVTDLQETAEYFCEACGSAWGDAKRWAAVRWGEWKASKPFRGIAGFWWNRLYSHIRSLSEIVESFLLAKDYPERLKVWVNTTLAETWDEKGYRVDEGDLLKRREEFGPKVPAGVAVVTAGIDVHPDRLEIEILGFGRGEEIWSLDHIVNRGDPSSREPWAELDRRLLEPLEREDGVKLQIGATAIDSGGHNASAVYNFCRDRYARRVWAVRGAAGPGRPIWPRKASKKNIGKVNLFFVGVDSAKELIYARLNVEKDGPGKIHFPMDRDEEYFKQLTAEKVITTRDRRGFPKHKRWEKTRARNEALDCMVYAIAAFQGLLSGGLDLDKEAQRLEGIATAVRVGAAVPVKMYRRVRSAGVQL